MPVDRTPVKAPPWLYDYSWLDKVDLPPPKMRTAVDKCTSMPVLKTQEISRIARAKEVEMQENYKTTNYFDYLFAKRPRRIWEGGERYACFRIWLSFVSDFRLA